jgi:uncharacterized protein YacL (UPF0231 family)
MTGSIEVKLSMDDRPIAYKLEGETANKVRQLKQTLNETQDLDLTIAQVVRLCINRQYSLICKD